MDGVDELSTVSTDGAKTDALVPAALSGNRQRRSWLQAAGSIHWLHWLIIALSAVVTLTAYLGSRSAAEERARSRFDRNKVFVIDLVVERMQRYEDALWAGVAATHANDGSMDHAHWRTFAESLKLRQRYPGINGIGVIDLIEQEALAEFEQAQRQDRPGFTVHPNVDTRLHMPIVYIEPEGINAAAIGLDIAFEQHRREGAEAAHESGEARITGPIELVQDEAKTPGFLFFAPFNQQDGQAARGDGLTDVQRLIYMPFIMSRLMEGTLDKSNRQVRTRISDGAVVLYDEWVDDDPDYDSSPSYEQSVKKEIYGRTWTFHIAATKGFVSRSDQLQPMLILYGGLGVDALLLGLFLHMARVGRKLRDTAAHLTTVSQQLQGKASELERSNEELQSFAYVASHDLKTPVRGMGYLIEYLQEDLDPILKQTDASTNISSNLARLQQQTDHMNRLIGGILDYSAVGKGKDTVSSLDVAAMIRRICAEQPDFQASQLELQGELPVLETYAIRFEQVMANLIGNAFKYRHRSERTRIIVACRTEGAFHEFSVTDNGPGIDPAFHDRIFEVFQTLQPKNESDSSGVGLSIVKKSVEGLGGTIRVESTLDQGATFIFRWPITVAATANILQEAA